MWAQYGSRIYVIERDFYARQAIASYLSWDRRTRVVGMAGSPHEMMTELAENTDCERLNAVVLDTGLAASAAELIVLIEQVHLYSEQAYLICLADQPNTEWAMAAYRAGASAFYVREQVGIGIAGAVFYALHHKFSVTRDVAILFDSLCAERQVLPCRRHYDRLTPRIEQALWLCVVEGLPAELAAEEMGVSTSTVRSYIKEGYRILEAEDETSYPATYSPAERAFLRFTALEEEESVELTTPLRPAA